MLSLTKVFCCLALIATFVAVATCTRRSVDCTLRSYLVVPTSPFDHVSVGNTSNYTGLMQLLEQGLQSSEIEQFLSSPIPNQCSNGSFALNYTKHKFGYTATMTAMDAVVVNGLSTVKFVEEEQMYNATTHNMEWHLDRIDQVLGRDQRYEPSFTGAPVDMYIIDSGIHYTHQEFGGRAHYGGFDPYHGDGWDRMGHGTHVAALAAGCSVGSATRSNLYSVRVFDLGGTSTATIIDAVIHVILRVFFSTPLRRAVINMSLGGPVSWALNFWLFIAEMCGIVSVAAAGNNYGNACYLSPASSPYVMTAAASDIYDSAAYFSNFGSCVNIFAPGRDINSASRISDTSYVIYSGTSMASPLVAGAAAMALTVNPSATPSQVRATLVGWSSVGVLSSVPFGTPNRLLRVP